MTEIVVVNRLDYAGETYDSGETVNVEPGEARDLVNLGKARLQTTESDEELTSKPQQERSSKPAQVRTTNPKKES